MRVKNLKPNIQIAEYVDRLLVIENSPSNDSFSLPLFASLLPTLLFISPKAVMGKKSLLLILHFSGRLSFRIH